MSTLKLIVLSCLTASPSATAPVVCHEHTIAVLDDAVVTDQGCVAGAQPTLAQWVAAHPDRWITRWRCE